MSDVYARQVRAVLEEMYANGPQGDYQEALQSILAAVEPNCSDWGSHFNEADLVDACLALARARIRRDGAQAHGFAAACYDVICTLGIEPEEEEQPRWLKSAAALPLPA